MHSSQLDFRIKVSAFLRNANFTSWALIFLVAFEIVVSIWTINRGFDFSDEAFGYLGFTHPEEVKQTATYYSVLHNFLFSWLGVSIVKVRILRFILLLLCTVVFAYGLNRWLKRHLDVTVTAQYNLFLILILGAFFINANGSQSFTYNLYSVLLFLGVTGCFLNFFQTGAGWSRKEAAGYFGIGVMLFALFAVKFSNAIFLGLTLLILLAYDKRHFKLIMYYTGMIVFGAATLWILVFGRDCINWLFQYYEALTSLNSATSNAIWSRYREDYDNVSANLFFAQLPLIGTSVGLLFLNYRFDNKIIKIVTAVAFAILMTRFSYKHALYLGGSKHIYTITLIYLFISMILLISFFVKNLIDAIGKKQIKWSRSMVVFLLLLVPFYGSLGTNNLLSVQFIWYGPFLFALLFLLLHAHSAYVLNTTLIVLGLSGVVHSVSGVIYYPYRIKGTLSNQSVRPKLEAGDDSVLLDKGLAESIENINHIIRSRTKYQDGDPIFSFRSEFGFIYFLNGTLPGWNWYREEAPEATCANITKSQIEDISRLIVIFPKDFQVDSVLQSCLKEKNINLTRYQVIGESSYEFDGGDRRLEILAPVEMLKK